MPSTFDDSISLDATAGYTTDTITTFEDGITLSSTAGYSTDVVVTFETSLIFSDTAGYSTSVLATFEPSLTFTETNDFILGPNLVIDSSVTFTETNSVTFTLDPVIFGCSIAFSETNTIAFDAVTINEPAVIFAGTAGFSIDSGPNIYNRPPSNTLIINTLAVNHSIFVRSASNTITFGEFGSLAHILQPTASNTLVFTQDAEHLKFGDAINTFVINQFVTISSRVRRQSASNSIVFNQIASNSSVFSRQASNLLEFNETFSKYTGIGDIFVEIPQADSIIVPRNCNVILESSSRSIVLPCPRFDDTQEWSSLNVNLKRSILGGIRTYVKRSGLAKIKYTFWLGRLKSLELRRFILDFTDKQITMTNFKGEVWLGHILNNPGDLTPKQRYEPERERVDFTLEFEGIKIRG